MARVFLSYRRADGAYAVGWIADRLNQLDEVSDVRSAFSDTELRCGDDFPSALMAEIEACDVMVILMGPNWLGSRSDGSNRLHDPSDWVAREVATALGPNEEQRKKILPLLLEGAQPISAADLPPHLAPLADIHAVAFTDLSELNKVIEGLRLHLHEVDRQRARTVMLDQPIEIAPFRLGAVGIAATLAAGAVGAVGGYGLTQARATHNATAKVDTFIKHDFVWTTGSMVEMSIFCMLAVIGHQYVWRHWSPGLKIKWRPILLSFAFGTLATAWLILAFGNRPPIYLGAPRSWLQSTLGLALVAPWILTLFGAAWTTSVIEPHHLGRRVEVIGRLERANRVASAMIAVAIAPIAFTIRGLDNALTVSSGSSISGNQLVAFGLMMSLLLGAGAIWGRMQLRVASEALTKDLADIGPEYRRNAEEHLVTDLFVVRPWFAWGWLLLPLASAVLAVIVAKAPA